MAVTYREMTYKTFGRVLAIENGVIELYVTLDVGPRIIRYSTVGGANVMHEDIDAKIVEKARILTKFSTPVPTGVPTAVIAFG